MKDAFRIICIIIGIIVFVLLLFSPDTSKQEKEKAEVIIKEYPALEDYQIFGTQSIKGIVQKAELGEKRYLKGALYVTLYNGGKFSIGGTTNNYQYEPAELFYFLQVNDSISKPANDNLFLIYRNGERYFFKLGQSINRKKEDR